MTNKFFWAISCLFISLTATAQEKWTLQRCVEQAIQNNVGLKINNLTNRANESTLMQSKMARLPNLSGQLSQNWSTGRNVDPRTNAFVDRDVWSSNWGFNSNVTLFNGFALSNTIKQNEFNLQASQLDYERFKNDVTLNVINAYLQIVLNKELIGVAQIQLQNTQEQLDRTLKLIEGGRLAEANKYDLISQKANDELRIVNAENTLAIAELRLKQLLQLSADEPFSIEIPQIADPENAPLATATMVYETAEATQPSIKNADMLIKSAEVGVDIAKANRMPTLSFGGNINSVYSSLTELPNLKNYTPSFSTRVSSSVFTGRVIPTDPIIPTDPNDARWLRSLVADQPPLERSSLTDQWFNQNLRYGAGFTLQIPLYNRHQVINGINQSKIQVERTKLQAVNTRNTLRQTIEQAVVDAKAANKSFIANRIRATALNESTRIAEQRFVLGAVDVMTYTLSKNNLAIAQSDMVRSKYEYIFRLKVLDFYLGKEIKL
jgi:outer membrane protein